MSEEEEKRHSDDKHATELEWIAKNRPYLWEHHAGQWIAVKGAELIAVSDSHSEVYRLAREKGVQDPLITGVRYKEFQGVKLVRRT